jgi:hypothetical protein
MSLFATDVGKQPATDGKTWWNQTVKRPVFKTNQSAPVAPVDHCDTQAVQLENKKLVDRVAKLERESKRLTTDLNEANQRQRFSAEQPTHRCPLLVRSDGHRRAAARHARRNQIVLGSRTDGT